LFCFLLALLGLQLGDALLLEELRWYVSFLFFLLMNNSQADGVLYEALNCTGVGDDWKVGPTLMHVVTTNLTTRSVAPVTAPPASKLATLPDMLDSSTIAAINGGYFWEVLNGSNGILRFFFFFFFSSCRFCVKSTFSTMFALARRDQRR
jgi:hypothetical protein